MSIQVFRLEIWGRVQGVYFRQSMVECAQSLGVNGWVRNRQDGSVEATVAGHPQAIERMLAWAHQGPPGARVDRVDVQQTEGTFSTFERWPSV